MENGDVAGAAVEMAVDLEVPALAPEIFQEVHNDCYVWVLLHSVAETFGHFHVFFAEEAAVEGLYPQQGIYFLLDCDCDSYVQEVQVVQEAQVVQIGHYHCFGILFHHLCLLLEDRNFLLVLVVLCLVLYCS